MYVKNRKLIIFITILVSISIMACHIPLVGKTIGSDSVATQIPKVVTPTHGEPSQPDVEQLTPEQATPTEAEKDNVYTANGIEITLPDTFVVGEVEEIESLLEEEGFLDSDQAQSVESMFEMFRDDILLWGYDNNPKREGETGLFVMENEQFGGMSLMMISVFLPSMMGSQVEIVAQERLTLGGHDMLRFLAKSSEVDIQGSQVFYIFNEDGKLWIIGFFTNLETPQDRLQFFDDTVASFNIIAGE